MTNNRPQTIEDTFARRGIKSRTETREDLNFVGRNSRTTFSQMETKMVSRFTPTNTDVAVLGEAYQSVRYGVTTTAKVYEDIYGDTDFSESVVQDPTVRQTLDDVFGNNDNDPTGEAAALSEEEARVTVGRTGSTQVNAASLLEINKGLGRAQAGFLTYRDEDTRGIRGVDDIDAKIEPIA